MDIPLDLLCLKEMTLGMDDGGGNSSSSLFKVVFIILDLELAFFPNLKSDVLSRRNIIYSRHCTVYSV